MFQAPWRDPVPIDQWAHAPLGAGLYIIGCAQDERLPMGPCTDNEGKLGGFPLNFVPLYIGHSLSAGRGVRGRLSCHKRDRGNRYIGKAVASKVPLWFFTLAGRDMAEYESIYLDLPNGIYFPFNARSEVTRALVRMHAAMVGAGLVAEIAPNPMSRGAAAESSY